MRYLERRLSNILGDSALDDAVTKKFSLMIEQKMELLMKERDPLELAHAQGFVAALREAIEEVRRNNKRNLTTQDDDNEED
jgi:hypothetical protein